MNKNVIARLLYVMMQLKVAVSSKVAGNYYQILPFERLFGLK
jgi:hypothetical protein